MSAYDEIIAALCEPMDERSDGLMEVPCISCGEPVTVPPAIGLFCCASCAGRLV